jgi:hypothetical protein
MALIYPEKPEQVNLKAAEGYLSLLFDASSGILKFSPARGRR